MARRAKKNTISGAVSIYDVQQTLETKDSDLKSLCTNSNINFWSKYKPVVRMDKTDSSKPWISVSEQWNSTTNNWKSDSDWWKGYPNNFSGKIHQCGFLIPMYQNMSQLFNARKNNSNYGWSKVIPQDNQGYRLSDFSGYNHNATVLCKDFQSDKDIYNLQNDPVKLSFFSVISSSGQTYLTWADFPTLKDCYFGVVIWNKNNDNNQSPSVYNFITQSVNLGNITTSPQIQISGLQQGIYYALPFISTDQYSSLANQNIPISNIYSFPAFNAVQFQVANDTSSWLKIKSVEVSETSDYKKFRVTIGATTFRTRGNGNYNSQNEVGVCQVKIKFRNYTGSVVPVDSLSNASQEFIRENYSVPLFKIQCKSSGESDVQYYSTDILQTDVFTDFFTQTNHAEVTIITYENDWNNSSNTEKSDRASCRLKTDEITGHISGSGENSQGGGHINENQIPLDGGSNSSGDIDMKQDALPII